MPDGLPRIDPETIVERIGSLLAERRPGAVKPLLAALARLAPDHDRLALLQAEYWCQMQDVPQALDVLDAAIARVPGDAALWLRRSEIFFGAARFEESARTAAQAVLLAPKWHAAKSRLGLALLQLGRFDQALLCLAESFAGQPADPETALALAALSPDTAIDILARAVGVMPRQTILRNALLRRYLSVGDIVQARSCGGQAAADGIADAQTYCLLAFAEMETQNWAEATRSAARAKSIAPNDAWAPRLLAALSCRESGRLVPDSNDAEQALISGGAIAPGCFRALIEQSKIIGPVLDLFGGSGLNAIAAVGLAVGPWTGVDPSLAHIERSEATGLYAQLRRTEPMQALAAGVQYPVILLNEALGYWESPKPLLGAVRFCLAAGGLALAAIPIGRPGLGGNGLFAHRESTVAQDAHATGLTFDVSRSGILRHLEGLPVHGVIASFRAL